MGTKFDYHSKVLNETMWTCLSNWVEPETCALIYTHDGIVVVARHQYTTDFQSVHDGKLHRLTCQYVYTDKGVCKKAERFMHEIVKGDKK